MSFPDSAALHPGYGIDTGRAGDASNAFQISELTPWPTISHCAAVLEHLFGLNGRVIDVDRRMMRWITKLKAVILNPP